MCILHLPHTLFQIHVRTNLCVDVFIGGSSSIINKDALFGALGGILHWGIEPCVCEASSLPLNYFHNPLLTFYFNTNVSVHFTGWF